MSWIITLRSILGPQAAWTDLRRLGHDLAYVIPWGAEPEPKCRCWRPWDHEPTCPLARKPVAR